MIRAAGLGAVVAALAGCHHSKPPACDDCGGPMRNPDVVREENRRVQLCGDAATLHAAGCAPFTGLATATLDDCSVADDLFMSGYSECLGSTVCATVQACVARIDLGNTAPYDGPVRSCAATASRQPYGVVITEREHGVGAMDTKLGDTKSSLVHPIEVCRTPEEIGYLTRVTCADGSHPFADRAAAAAASRTPAGQGGTCGRAIDHIVVPCAEHSYDVFVDAYRCSFPG